jgi:hypothetical protein
VEPFFTPLRRPVVVGLAAGRRFGNAQRTRFRWSDNPSRLGFVPEPPR